VNIFCQRANVARSASKQLLNAGAWRHDLYPKEI
jgi:hypothetical protein